MRSHDNLDHIVLLERLRGTLLVRGHRRKVLQDVVDRDSRREGDALGRALDFVVERFDALFDQLVAFEAQLEDVGALGRLGDELLDDALDDTGRGLVLVESGGGDCEEGRRAAGGKETKEVIQDVESRGLSGKGGNG